ncbi:MAG: DUF554 domain-containing protein [Anaerolineae bacterium]|nr:DUF554 domain-containing protein [Anaerolineae bacterium]
MIGSIVNFFAVIVGGGLGLMLGNRLEQRVQNSVMTGLGLFTMLLGTMNFFETQNVLVVLGALLAGTLLGEWLHIEEGLARIGAWLQKKFVPRAEDDAHSSRFIEGFVVASLLFCVGPMAIMGSIQDGLSGDSTTLLVKSILDAFAAMAFASTLGIGVLFSAVIVLVYQGAISLLAVQMQNLITPLMMIELNAVGGVLLVGIAIHSLLQIKKIRMGSFLPALFLAPLIQWVISALPLG